MQGLSEAEMAGIVRITKVLNLKRKRNCLNLTIRDMDGGSVAQAEITIVSRALLLPYELKYIWSGKGPPFVDGIFVRRLVVRKAWRGKGHRTTLLRNIKALADKLRKRIYIDTKADNAPMQRLITAEGGAPNMYWHTPDHTLMVRYIWI